MSVIRNGYITGKKKVTQERLALGFEPGTLALHLTIRPNLRCAHSSAKLESYSEKCGKKSGPRGLKNGIMYTRSI